MPPWIIGTRKFVHEMNPDRCRTQSKLADESQLLEVYGFDQRDRTFTFFDSRGVDSTISATISNFMSINGNGTKKKHSGPGVICCRVAPAQAFVGVAAGDNSTRFLQKHPQRDSNPQSSD